MAYGRRNRGSKNSSIAMSTLGGLVGLSLGLYVFSKILAVVFATVNSSDTYFGLAMTFVQSLLPVIGIISAYLVIKRAIKAMAF